MSFGPQLPPGFKKPTPEDDSGDEAGPIGPALPPGLARKPSASRKDSSGSEEDDSIGPALPPGFRKPSGTADGCSSNGQRSVGPSLPPEGAISSSRRLVNTTEDSEDDDDVVGPGKLLFLIHSISVTRDRVPNLSTGYLLFSTEFQYSCLIGCLLFFKLYKSF